MSLRFLVATVPLTCIAFVAACAIPCTAAAQSKINVARLKKGDKLEVKHFDEWIPAEYVEPFGNGMIKVIREPFKVPVPTRLEDVRKPRRSAAAAGEENPFATEEEKVAARKSRTWSDQAGKFKVDAKLLRVDSDKVVLKRSDDKELTVPLSRLSDADREYVEAIDPEAAEKNEVAEKGTAKKDWPATAGKREETPPEKPEMSLTETNLGAAEVVDSSGEGWSYEPDPAPEQTPLRKVRLPLKKLDTFEHVQDILLAPTENRAFVTSVWSFQEQKINVTSLDLQRGTVGATALFSTQAAPIALSPDGKRILARSQSFGSGKTAELRLYQRNGMKATPEKAWIPYIHHGPQQKGVHGLYYPSEAEVVWADFLSSERIITLSQAGELAVWSVPDLKPLFQAKLANGSQAAVSRGKKFLAVAEPSGIHILRANTGKFAGYIPADAAAEGAAIDFSLDGRKLALLNRRSRLRVWDLTTQKLEREFYVPIQRTARFDTRELAWVAPNYLLAGNQLVDVDHYSTINAYHPMTSWSEYQGQVWLIDGFMTSPTLISETIPPKPIRDKWAKIPADALLVIKPGIEVAVEMQTSDAHSVAAREKIVQSLTERGIKVVPDSPIKLLGTIGPAQAEAVNYRSFGQFGSQGTAVSVQGNVATLSYQVNGETVWKFMTKTGAPMFVHMQKGESVAEAAQKQANLDSTVFDRVWIPVYVAKPVADPLNPLAASAAK